MLTISRALGDVPKMGRKLRIVPMVRTAVAILMLAGSAVMALGVMSPDPAQAQPVQYQFTPPPPVMPLHSSPSYGGLSAPSTGTYGYDPSAGVRPSHFGARTFHTRHGRPIEVPRGTAGHNTFHDRVSRCQQAGAAAGLSASGQSLFTGQCS
jgi:hypothetical protein